MSINDKMISLITKYQTNKPVNHIPRCVHYPSCSEYSKQCYQKFNFFKATFLMIKRIVCCVPFNKKHYDPVPLSRLEKKQEKALKQETSLIEPILLEHYHKYPLMTITDFIKLIYQNTFGPYHLHTPSIEKIKVYLEQEMKDVTIQDEVQENIGNNYIRIHLSVNTNIDQLAEVFYQNTLINTNNNQNIHLFFLKINVLIKLIKKKAIKLPKKESIVFLNEYLANGIVPVHHSDIFNQAYHPHYRVIRKNH